MRAVAIWRVAIGRFHEIGQGFGTQLNLLLPQPMFPIGQRPGEDRPNRLRPQALQRKDTAATHQSAGQSEIGILCRGADERDHPRLNVWQQHILLRLVEAVDLINKQAGALAVILQSAPCRLEHIAQLLHS